MYSWGLIGLLMQVYGERVRAALGDRGALAGDSGAGAVRDAARAARGGVAAAAALARERRRGVRGARLAARAHRPVAARRRGARGGRRGGAHRQGSQLARRRPRAPRLSLLSARRVTSHSVLPIRTARQVLISVRLCIKVLVFAYCRWSSASWRC